MIELERNPMAMGGCAWYLANPADLGELDAKPARLIAPRLRALFEGFPDSVTELAERAPLSSLAAWLKSLAGARCRLEVHDTRHYGKGARLRFHFSELWAPSFNAVAGRAPRQTPTLLREVHSLIGDVDVQFGCSGSLVPLDQMPTVSQLVRGRLVLNADEIRLALEERPELRAFRGFYAGDGDWLCFGPEQRTLWLGGEWMAETIQPAQQLADALDALFAALLRQERFTPG